MASSSRSLLFVGLPKDLLATLTRNGYESTQDLSSATAEELVKDLKVSLEDAQMLIHKFQKPPSPTLPLPLTQSAAVMMQNSNKISTKCAPLDKILEGGVLPGQILEISGPPGCPKEKIGLKILESFVEKDDDVLFVDCQNMVNPSTLACFMQEVPGRLRNFQRQIYHTKVHTTPELMLFLHQLPILLKSRPKVALLVLNSLSFPLQQPHLSVSQRAALLERIKQVLSQVSASSNLTIVSITQLANKVFNVDDGNGGTTTKGILSPYLGPSYLPAGKTYRVILSPDSTTSGFVKLLSSPKYPPGSGNTPIITEPYLTVNGVID